MWIEIELQVQFILMIKTNFARIRSTLKNGFRIIQILQCILLLILQFNMRRSFPVIPWYISDLLMKLPRPTQSAFGPHPCCD